LIGQDNHANAHDTLHFQWPLLQPGWTGRDFARGQMPTALTDLWQQGCHGSITSQHGLQLHYSHWRPAAAKAALLLVAGRIETAHKYIELIADATSAGYQVYVLDHRGQGRSDRLHPGRMLGDVVHFDHYVDDLQQFIQQIVQPLCQLPMLAIAHSMGSAILTRYLQTKPDRLLHAAVFSSPMWGIQTAPLPQLLARPISQLMQQLEQQFSQESWYLPGQGDYQEKAFAQNELTSCEPRYLWFRQLYQQHPEYQLGGASWRWLAQALQACQQLRDGPTPILPCLLLQAGADTIVSYEAQQRLWQQWQQHGLHAASQSLLLPGARHELLGETDLIRLQWYQAIAEFLLGLSR
jgi:lysophospholipase